MFFKKIYTFFLGERHERRVLTEANVLQSPVLKREYVFRVEYLSVNA